MRTHKKLRPCLYFVLRKYRDTEIGAYRSKLATILSCYPKNILLLFWKTGKHFRCTLFSGPLVSLSHSLLNKFYFTLNRQQIPLNIWFLTTIKTLKDLSFAIASSVVTKCPRKLNIGAFCIFIQFVRVFCANLKINCKFSPKEKKPNGFSNEDCNCALKSKKWGVYM